MGMGRITGLSQEAAKETRRRIREDRKRVSAQLWPVLEYVAEHLLDDALQVGTMWAACGIGDDAMGQRFARELKKKPSTYIAHGRMEVGARMLLASDLTVWQIAAEVCYGSGSAFARAFVKWGGQSPGEYRAAPRKKVTGELDPAVWQTPETLGEEEQQRILAGELDEAEAEALLCRVESIRERLFDAHPGLRPPAATPVPAPAPASLPAALPAAPRPPAPPVLGAAFIEQSMAESLWRKIRHLPFEEQRATIRGQVAFSTPALFEVLWRECYAAAVDGGAAVEIGELLHESLEPIAASLGPYLPSFQARAHATLGVAWHSASDFEQAAACFDRAEKLIGVAGDAAHPVTVVELCIAKASLHADRGEAEEAAELMDAAVRVTEALVARLKGG